MQNIGYGKTNSLLFGKWLSETLSDREIDVFGPVSELEKLHITLHF